MITPYLHLHELGAKAALLDLGWEYHDEKMAFFGLGEMCNGNDSFEFDV